MTSHGDVRDFDAVVTGAGRAGAAAAELDAAGHPVAARTGDGPQRRQRAIRLPSRGHRI